MPPPLPPNLPPDYGSKAPPSQLPDPTPPGATSPLPSRPDRVQEQILDTLRAILNQAKSENRSLLSPFDPRPSLATSGSVIFNSLPADSQQAILGLRGTFEPLWKGLENVFRTFTGGLKDGFGKEVFSLMSSFFSGVAPASWSKEAGHLANSLGEAIGAEVPGMGSRAAAESGGPVSGLAGKALGAAIPAVVSAAGSAAGGGVASGAGAAGAGAAVTGGVAALASNPIGWVVAAVAAIAAVTVAFATLPSAIASFTESLLEGERKYAQGSASLAAVFAEADIRRLYREIEIGQRIAGTARLLADSQARLADDTKEFEVFQQNLKNLGGYLLNLAGSAVINADLNRLGASAFGGPLGAFLYDLLADKAKDANGGNNPLAASLKTLVEAANKYLAGDQDIKLNPIDDILQKSVQYHSPRRP